MKIGFVLDDGLDKPDGVQQYILTLGRWLQQTGHEVHYLVGETHRRDLPHLHSLGRNIKVTFNGNRMSIPWPVNKRRLTALLEQQQFDVLHIQMPYSPMLGGRVIKAAPPSTAVTGTFHIVAFSWRERIATRLLWLLLRKSLRRIDQTISVSPPAARFARSGLGIRTAVIPNVVDLQAMRSAQPIKKYQDGKLNIVFLGRLVERKGCLQLLHAVELLHRQHHLDNVRVIICGKGHLNNSLQKYVQANHLSKIVHFTGFVTETQKASYLAIANIAAFPSLGGESFGIVLAEAMAAGSQVVVAGDNPGYRSVLGDRPVQLVDPTDTIAFSKKLLHFIRNARDRRAAARWQQYHVIQYDIRHVGPQIVNRYEAAIANLPAKTK